MVQYTTGCNVALVVCGLPSWPHAGMHRVLFPWCSTGGGVLGGHDSTSSNVIWLVLTVSADLKEEDGALVVELGLHGQAGVRQVL